MKLIVGLGNPGAKYAQNRHNLGFMVIDALAANLGATPWHLEPKFKAELAEASLGEDKLLLAKPQTFMNNSGQAVQAIVHYYKDELTADGVYVIYDDLDLEVGEIRTKHGGSAAGHNGVQSVIDHLGPDFHHIRIGIGANDRTSEPSEVYVLKDMPQAELKSILSDTKLFNEVGQLISEQ